MLLLSMETIHKQFNEQPLLKDVTLYVQSGDKVGVIGPNGSGKSTLLKIAAGAATPDSGHVSYASGLRLAYLEQDSTFCDQTPLLAFVMEKAGDGAEYEAKTVLTRLGLTDFDRPVAALSGGQKKRAALAAVLLRQADLLILDEPTNHLDTEMIAWLEQFLIQYKGAVLMVTHDRYFLERVTGRIAEVEPGAFFVYEANYGRYLELKAQRLEEAAGRARKRASLMKKELAWMQQGPKARGTKSQFRIDRFHKMEQEEAVRERQTVSIAQAASRMGKDVIEVENLSGCVGGRPVLSGFSCSVQRAARIGIVGPNGSGKTTLLNLVSGRLSPDGGKVTVGQTVKIGYFTQHSDGLDPNQRPADYITGRLETAEGTLTASQMLETFLFDPVRQYTHIGRLSGGEKRRLYLLKVLMEAPNVLLLDEPTNDLDIETLTVLEDYLQNFQGAVLAVSHDRYFLDKIADEIFEVTEGAVNKYTGGYTDYTQKRALPEKAEKIEREKTAKPKEKKLKFSYNEQQEYERIDGEIAELEEKVAAAQTQIEAAAGDYVRLQEVMEEKETLEAQLEEKLERWVYLNELAEQIAEGR